jgi:hypothetical protein
MDWSHIGQLCMEQLLPVLGTILAGILSALAGLAIAYLRRKWGLEISDQQAQMIGDIVRNGISYAEEQAQKMLKAARDEKGSFNQYTSAGKLDTAIIYIIEEMKRQGLPELTRDSRVKLVEARIEEVRP